MKIEVIEEKENPLLERKELKVRIIHDAATPTRIDVKKEIEAMKTAEKGVVVVGSFKSKFGFRESTGVVRIYKDKDKALKTEPTHLLKKNLLVVVEEKEKKPAEKPKEAPKEKAHEKPEEAKKEVAKKEEKAPEAQKEKPKEAAKKQKEAKGEK